MNPLMFADGSSLACLLYQCTFTDSLLLPAGTVAVPSMSLPDKSGFYEVSSGKMGVAVGPTGTVTVGAFSGAGYSVAQTYGIGFYSSGLFTCDTWMSRAAANVMQVGKTCTTGPDSQGFLQTGGYAGNGTATFAAGAAAGTSPGTPACAASHICDSFSGTVTLTMGTSTTTGILLTVTIAPTHANQDNCVGVVELTASPYTSIPLQFTESTTTVVFNVGTAPTASTAYTLTYVCGGR